MIKKVIAREFLWLLAALLLAAPLSILLLGSFDLLATEGILTPKERIYITEFFLFTYFISFTLVYVFRLTLLAIQILASKDETE